MTYIEYSWEERAFFILMTVACLAIAIYFACSKKSTNQDHVWGGGTLGIWPVSMSLIATSLSSITLSFANEVYQYGGHIVLDLIGTGISGGLCWILIPTLYPLKLMSLNEYGALRFNKPVKFILSIDSLIYMALQATIITHSTALFISQLSGLGTMNCFLIIIVFAYILASIGGFKGVVWTDTLQAVAMLISIVILAVIGVSEAGGIRSVYKSVIQGDRLSFDWSFNPTRRLTVWSSLIMTTLQRITSGSIVSPTMYQRYTALLTEKQAKKTLVIQTLGTAVIVSFTFILGYVIYSLFRDCDPVLSGKASKYDQVLPYFIEYVGQRVKMARCVYTVGFVSATVSTLSSFINTFAVTLYRDFAQQKFNEGNDKIRGQRIIQLLGLVMVAVNILAVQIFQYLGSVMDLTGFVNTPATVYASIMLIGVFLPWIGPQGIIYGSLISGGFTLWIIIGTQTAVSKGLITYPTQTMGLGQCINTTTIPIPNEPLHDDVFLLYKITTFLQPTISLTLILVIASFITLIIGSKHLSQLDERLIFPKFRRFIPRRNNIQKESVPLRIINDGA